MRATSLDELPQLINVVKGEMSLVGPRPERPEFVEVFNQQIRRYGERHRVKAGMTGWAQVHGLRGQTSIGDRAEWDNFYIENWSLALDLQILLMTVAAVLRPAEPLSRVAPQRLHVVAPASALTATTLTQQLREWLAQRVDLSEERRADVMLCVYEALSNCVEHAYRGGRDPDVMTLDVTYDSHSARVRACISDRGRWVEPVREGGRGLELMRTLSDAISVDGRPDGTTVSLEFRNCAAIPAAAPRH
jgi:anti-sigma regulatory factor (Ser/Thr protein kinase)